jgi:hypothetical protein
MTYVLLAIVVADFLFATTENIIYYRSKTVSVEQTYAENRLPIRWWQPRSNVTNYVNGRIQPYTEVNDRIFVRIPPYLSVYDTEIYDRNTITCKSSYFFVCGRLRPCLFDLGILLLMIAIDYY